MRRALLMLGTILAAGCTASRPGADSAAAAPRPDTTAAAVPAPSATDSAPRAPQTQVPAGRPATPEDTMPTKRPARTPAEAPVDSPTRPRLTPRPPHPVPHRMPPRDTTDTQPGGDQARDQAAIDRLMREAKGLAHATGCTAADQCAVLPLGAKACGGPVDYVVYCPRTTDVAALKRKAADLERAQKAFNQKYHIMSTCELRQPPRAAMVGRSCRAAYVNDAPVVPQH